MISCLMLYFDAIQSTRPRVFSLSSSLSGFVSPERIEDGDNQELSWEEKQAEVEEMYEAG